MGKNTTIDETNCSTLNRPRTRLTFKTVVAHGPITRTDVAERIGARSVALQDMMTCLIDAGYVGFHGYAAKGAKLWKALKPLSDLFTYGDNEIVDIKQDIRRPFNGFPKANQPTTTPQYIPKKKTRPKNYVVTKNTELHIANIEEARSILSNDVEAFMANGGEIVQGGDTWDENNAGYTRAATPLATL